MNKFNGLFHELGYLGAAIYLLDRLLSKLSFGSVRVFQFLLYYQPVSTVPLLPPKRGHKIKISVLSGGDLNVLAFPRPQKVLEQRLASGDKCFLAFMGEELVGFSWLSFCQYAEDNVRCNYEFGNDVVWDYDIYIEPRYRIGFAFAKLWQHVNEYMLENDIKGSMSRISAENTPSIRSHEKLGGVKIGSQIFVRIGVAQLMLSSKKPFFHVSVFSSSRPRVFLCVPDNLQK